MTLRPHVDAPPPEAPKVVETGMGANADALGFRLLHHAPHDGRIARMKTAGDIGGFYDVENGGVVADVVSAETFRHIGVEIDHERHWRNMLRTGRISKNAG